MSDWRQYVVATPLTIALVLAALAVGSVTAVMAAASGDDDKVSVCHNGQLIDVSSDALADHLGHGDTTDSCPAPSSSPDAGDGLGIDPLFVGGAIAEKTTLCHNGRTISIGSDGQADHIGHGDSIGACAAGQLKSNNAGGRAGVQTDGATEDGDRATVCHRERSLTISSSAVADHEAHGDLAGACATESSTRGRGGGRVGPATAESIPEGKAAVCHRGRTLVIGEDGLSEHVAHGDSAGLCPS